MAAEVNAKAFRNGNSVAIRLPKAFGVSEGDEVILAKSADGRITIRPREDAEAKRREWLAVLDELKAMGPPPDGVQKRLPVDIPIRKGM